MNSIEAGVSALSLQGIMFFKHLNMPSMIDLQYSLYLTNVRLLIMRHRKRFHRCLHTSVIKRIIPSVCYVLLTSVRAYFRWRFEWPPPIRN